MEQGELAQAFAGVAAAYERGRPGYPASAIEALELGPGRTVVEVGAGTGKLTRLLAATGADVVAVEPLDELRAYVERLDGVRALAGRAEALPLPDASADAAAAGQAFHWFRGPEALAELHRVLRPGGRLALLWNRLDRADGLTAAFAAVLDRYRGHRSFEGPSWSAAFEATGLFGPLEEAAVPHVQEVDAEILAARLASESSIAVLPDERRLPALAEVRALVRGKASLRYVTEVYVTERRNVSS